MAAKPSATNVPTELDAQQIVEFSTVMNEMAMNNAHVNAYEVRNALLIERKKNRIRYLNGYTEMPATVAQMLANAEDRKYNHRRTLARNISAVEEAKRPGAACAHHIVALTDKEARRSRDRIFKFGIAINDADNGVFLPRHSVGLPGYPKAAHHSPYHSPRYHGEVWLRLRTRSEETGTREELKGMKADLLAGRMTL